MRRAAVAHIVFRMNLEESDVGLLDEDSIDVFGLEAHARTCGQRRGDASGRVRLRGHFILRSDIRRASAAWLTWLPPWKELRAKQSLRGDRSRPSTARAPARDVRARSPPPGAFGCPSC